MLFRRKMSLQNSPIQALETKVYEYQGQEYYVAQWPDSSQIAVSAHGETFNIISKETESKGHSLFEVRDHRGYWVDTATTPQKALESCCQRLQQRHEYRVHQEQKAQQLTAKERLAHWFQTLPETKTKE